MTHDDDERFEAEVLKAMGRDASETVEPSHDEVEPETIQVVAPICEIDRLDSVLRAIAMSHSPAIAMAIRAAVLVAARSWTVSDELRFGSLTREELSLLLGYEINYAK